MWGTVSTQNNTVCKKRLGADMGRIILAIRPRLWIF